MGNHLRCSFTKRSCAVVFFAVVVVEISFRVTLCRWKCRCFTSEYLDQLIGVPKHLGRVDPTQDITQSAMEAETKGNFDSDSALKAFLSSTQELKNSKSADSGAVSNVCNPQRSVNVATVYLAKALGLNVASLVDGYTYNWAVVHSFPMNSTAGPSETFEPTGDKGQAYWTLLDQYTSETEPEMRAGKGRNWCHHQGIGVHSHCLQVWTKKTPAAPPYIFGPSGGRGSGYNMSNC